MPSWADALLWLGVLLTGVAVILSAMRRLRWKQLADERLEAFETAEQLRPSAPGATRSILARHRLVGWLVGLLSGVAAIALGLPPIFAAALTVVAGLLANQVEAMWSIRRATAIEVQLADAIDLMIGALGAGAGVMVALESAAHEARDPIRSPLEDLVGRIRLGDDPQVVFRGSYERVPLETFLLFASALAVQWETGGSLSPTLATVGRTVRDRIELGRRIRSNVVLSQLSTVVVLAVTYFLALVIWRSNPERMREFLATTFGQWAVAGSMLLEAVGIVWMSSISRARF